MKVSYPESVKEGCLDMTGFDKEFVPFENIHDMGLQWLDLVDEDVLPDAANHPQLA